MFKRFFVFFCLQLLIVPSIWAQQRAQTVESALDQVEQIKAQSQTWEGRHADEPYVVLLNEYDTQLNDNWSYEEKYHTRVKVQKDAAKNLGEWPVYYNKSREEIVDVQAFVENSEGKKFPASNIQDNAMYEKLSMYSDMRVKAITLPQVNVGSIIDITVKSRVKFKQIPNQFWDDVTPPVIPTKYARQTFVFPEDKKIVFKNLNTDLKPVVEKAQGLVKYSFIFKETDYNDEEDFMPPADEVTGKVYLSSIEDWKVVADWYRDLLVKNIVDDEIIKAKALELTKDKTTLKDKARAIIEFIQDNFRYVSMSLDEHDVAPHQTSDIFRNRYGDCKDLSLLARQMLNLVGVKSSFCLFSGEFNGDPEHALPNLNAFDHAIIEVALDDKSYFVDPQAKGFDFGQLPSSYDNAHVLVIEDVSFRFDHLPVSNDQTSSIITQSDVQIKPEGAAIYDVHVKLPLEVSQSFKDKWASTNDRDKDKFFDQLEANFTQGGQMIKRDVKGLDNRYGPVEFHLNYFVPNAYAIVNDMVLVREQDQSNIPDFAAPTRQYPIFVPSNSLIQNTSVYHIPQGYKVDFVPKDFQLNIDFVDISSTFRNDKDTVTANSMYRMKRAEIPPQRYAEVKKFREQLYQRTEQYIVLKKSSSITDQAKDWIKKQ